MSASLANVVAGMPRQKPGRKKIVSEVLCALVLYGLLGFNPTDARPLTAVEKAALAERVGTFETAMRSNDLAGLVSVIPPRVLEHIADRAGIAADDVRTVVIEQMAQVLADGMVDSFAMDLPLAEQRELSDGTPYVLIPTKTVIATGNGSRMLFRSHTLALLDENGWYLLRMSDARQLEILREVYPGYAGVEFPLGSMEALSQ